MKHLIAKATTAAAVLGGGLYTGAANAATQNVQNFSDLTTHISNTAGSIFKIAMVIITLAGLFLVIKGIVHLKQNYTGTGQEKHLSKGIASLVFGACLFIVVPIAHVLVGGIAGDSKGQTYNSFSISGGGYAGNLGQESTS
jgi:succinate dehydrogenase/fumarate reductase cytochrome b subunit